MSDNRDSKSVIRSNVRPAPPLTPAMMRLAAHLLSMAGERFSNDGCTMLDLSQIEGFESHESRVALDHAYNGYNRSPEEHNPARVTRYTDNWCMMHLCAASLRKAAESSGKAEVAFTVLQEVLGIALVGLRSAVERHGADDQCLLNVEAGLRELGLDPDELHRGALRTDEHVSAP